MSGIGRAHLGGSIQVKCGITNEQISHLRFSVNIGLLYSTLVDLTLLYSTHHDVDSRLAKVLLLLVGLVTFGSDKPIKLFVVSVPFHAVKLILELVQLVVADKPEVGALLDQRRNLHRHEAECA